MISHIGRRDVVNCHDTKPWVSAPLLGESMKHKTPARTSSDDVGISRSTIRGALIERASRASFRVAAMTGLAVLCVMSLRCDFGHGWDWDPYVPPASSYGYHTHQLVVSYRALNWDDETLGIARVNLSAAVLHASRAETGEHANSGAEPKLSPRLVFDLSRSDTLTHACTASVQHLVGYQLKLGGDTSHLGTMDSLDGWHMALPLQTTQAYLARGLMVLAYGEDIDSLPDTLRPDQPLLLDLTFDMDGLFSWLPDGSQRLRLHTDHVRCRQR